MYIHPERNFVTLSKTNSTVVADHNVFFNIEMNFHLPIVDFQPATQDQFCKRNAYSTSLKTQLTPQGGLKDKFQKASNILILLGKTTTCQLGQFD